MSTNTKWFGNSVHQANASAGDRTSKARNRALYRNTMNVAAQGGLKAVPGRGPLPTQPRPEQYYEPAVLLNGECVSLPGETGPNGCVAYYVRSARSYQNLLQLTRGVYEGRPPKGARMSTTNSDTFRSTLASNPTSSLNRYNYLTLTDAGGPIELLALSAPKALNALYVENENNERALDPTRCMQYPPNPRTSITWGGGGCFVAD